MTNNSKNESESVIDLSADEKHVRRINTYKDLLEEEQRLTMKLKRERTAIASGLYQIKSKFAPASALLGSVSNVLGNREKPSLVAQGVDMVIDVVTKKYLFKSSGWIMTLLGSYAVRGVSQLLLRNKKKEGGHDGTVPADLREAEIKRSKN
jgi:hypothetical protein